MEPPIQVEIYAIRCTTSIGIAWLLFATLVVLPPLLPAATGRAA